MGSNSSDALKAFLDEYIKRCRVHGNRILTPEEVPAEVQVLIAPVRGVTLDGTEPDYKRGQ